MLPTEELGRLARWRTRARPRPREVPVMRYVDICYEVGDKFDDRWMLLEFVHEADDINDQLEGIIINIRTFHSMMDGIYGDSCQSPHVLTQGHIKVNYQA